MTDPCQALQWKSFSITIADAVKKGISLLKPTLPR